MVSKTATSQVNGNPILMYVGLALLPAFVNVPSVRDVPAWSLMICSLILCLFFIGSIHRSYNLRNQRHNLISLDGEGAQILALPILLGLIVLAGFAQSVVRGGYGVFNWFTQFGSIVLVAAFCANCVSRGRSYHAGTSWITAMVFGSFFFLILNFCLLALGVTALNYRSDAVGPNRMLMNLGVYIDRQSFPVSGGQNATAIICVLMLSICIAALTVFTARWQRAVALMASALCVLGVVLADARGGYLALVAVALVYFFRGRAFVIVGVFLFAASLTVLPLIVKALVAVLPPNLVFDAFGQHLPKNFDAVAVLTTGRNFIWDAAIERILSDPLNLLFGYGVRAHLTSGVSVEYAWLFGGNVLHTLHNWLLQMVFEYGLVGSAVFFATFVWMVNIGIKRLTSEQESRSSKASALATVLILLTFVVCGATEAVLSTNLPDHFIFFGLCLGFVRSLRAGSAIGNQQRDFTAASAIAR